MRNLKKLVVLSAAVVLAAVNVVSVSAASLKDCFDADFYASAYEDVKEAFGNDADALYQHYVQFGINEGRQSNQYFDVKAYRERYADLDAAFGDDWDAYYTHYLTYGLKEGRSAVISGIPFDAQAYAEANPDVKEAYGDDVAALFNHYITYGLKEGRELQVQEPEEEEDEEDEPEESKPEESKPEENEPDIREAPIGGRTETSEADTDGNYTVSVYNANDVLVLVVNYDKAGIARGASVYDARGTKFNVPGSSDPAPSKYIDGQYHDQYYVLEGFEFNTEGFVKTQHLTEVLVSVYAIDSPTIFYYYDNNCFKQVRSPLMVPHSIYYDEEGNTIKN